MLSPSSIIPINKCSVPIYSEPSFLASRKAFSITLLVLGVKPIAEFLPSTGTLPINSSISASIFSGEMSWFSKTLLATPVPSLESPYNKCSVPI